MECFSTAKISPKEKLEYWQHLCSREYSSLDIIAQDGRNFDGTLLTHPAGAISVSQVSSSPGKIVRAEKHIAPRAERKFQLFVYREGGGRCFQFGQQGTLEPGDFVLFDISMPYRFEFSEFCSAISIGLPEDLLRSYLPQPEAVLALPMSGAHGLGQVASLMLRSIHAQLQSGELKGVDSALAKGMVNILACAYADRSGARISGSAALGMRLAGIRRYIESNLPDPRLTPSTVAAANGISPRYLRLLFSKGNETASQYILRRRLEECADRLRDEAWRGTKITDIAVSWGFSDASSFARAFREHFGSSPREYRRSHKAPKAEFH